MNDEKVDNFTISATTPMAGDSHLQLTYNGTQLRLSPAWGQLDTPIHKVPDLVFNADQVPGLLRALQRIVKVRTTAGE